MTDIKTNLRDGAYVALGAAALGVQHLSKKRDVVKARFDGVASKFEPVIKDVTPRIKDAGDKVGQTLSPLTERITPVAGNVRDTVSTHVLPAASAAAGKVSDGIRPATTTVVRHVKARSEQAITSGKKIADEAKRRVS